MDKVTSIRIDQELWRKAKIMAVKRGVTLRSIIEELLAEEVEAEELAGEEIAVSGEIKALEEERKKGRIPFKVISEKSAVELVREGRGA